MKNLNNNTTGNWQAFCNLMNDLYWQDAVNDLPNDQVTFMYDDFKNTYGMN